MRGRASFVAATCAAALIAVFAGAGAASGAPLSSVVGSGTGQVRGSGSYVDAFEVEGPITCMRVEGNRASIKYRFKKASGPGAPPQNGGVQVYIEDNGKPTGGQPVDRVATEPPQPPGAFDAAASVCTDPRLNPAWTPLESGDFDVFDAG
jgi:hypothetical protein